MSLSKRELADLVAEIEDLSVKVGRALEEGWKDRPEEELIALHLTLVNRLED